MCFQHRVSLCLMGNVLLSVSIILVNKLVFVKTNFPNVTLTLVHFIITYFGMTVCKQLNVFQAKKLPILQIFPLALSFCGFVVFTNLSLGHNTVGTFQLLKTLTMPTIMVIQTLFYNRTFSWKIKFTLIPIIFGVFLNSAYDIQFSILGTLYALIGVSVTSFYQVWVGEKQKELQVSSMQLLYYQAPVSAFFLLICIPIVEPPWNPVTGVLYKNYTADDMIIVFASGILAFLVNMSIYWIIGNTSAVTYNVVGQLKFCLTLIGGYLLFTEPISPVQMVGILSTMSGVYLYANFRNQDNNKLPFTTVEKR